MEKTMKLGAYQIADDTTIEEMQAIFFNTEALREPNYRLCQLNTHGNRYYYKMNEEGVEFYPSVTTILRKVAPENHFLTEWRLSLGKEAADAYTMERARYGTFVHGLLQELIITRKFDLDAVREKLEKYVEREKLPYGFVDAHEEEVKEDMISFATWVIDYDVQPLAVEIALYHPVYKFAGMLDLVCNMRTLPISDEKKEIEKAAGDEKKLAKIAEKYAPRVDAIVDFKTTRKEFVDDHALQLGMYRLSWNETFPDRPIEHLANVAPKNWTGTAKKVPSYRFEWQTENPVLRRIPPILELYKLEEEESRKVTLIGGEIDLNNKPLTNNVAVYTLEELIAERSKDKEAEVEADPLRGIMGMDAIGEANGLCDNLFD